MSGQPDLRPEDVPDRAPEDLQQAKELKDLDSIFDELTDHPTDGAEVSPSAETNGPTSDRSSPSRAGHTDDALGVWRERASVRRTAYEQAELTASNRRGVLARAVTVGFMLGLFLAWAVTEFILGIEEPRPAEPVAALPLDVPPDQVDVHVSASQAALSAETETPATEIVETPLLAPETAIPEEPSFDPKVLEDDFQSWVWRNHYWWQFDFEGTGALHLRWVGPDGKVKLEGWACENRVNTTIGRCYVGQSLTHFAPKPGTWTLHACNDAEFSACALVDHFDIAENLDVGRSSAPQ